MELGNVAVRDPAFYQLYRKVIQLFQQYQNSLPAYQYNDVLLPGVSIQNVQISQLVTFFNDYYVDLDSATVQQQGQQQAGQQQQQQQQIKAQLKRLDHTPYEYQITVQSEQNVPGAVVRVYLGPKHDYQGKPISISQHRQQFVELDQFVTDRMFPIIQNDRQFAFLTKQIKTFSSFYSSARTERHCQEFSAGAKPKLRLPICSRNQAGR